MNKFWKLYSIIGQPIFSPLWAALLFFYITPFPYTNRIIVETFVILFFITFLIPTVALFWLKKKKVLTDINLRIASERKYPLLIIIFCYIVATQVLRLRYNLNPLALCLSGATISLFIAYFALKWSKISMHCMGMAGLVAVAMAFGTVYDRMDFSLLFILAILLGLMATARINLKAHTVSEVIYGTLVGFIPQFGLILYAYLG